MIANLLKFAVAFSLWLPFVLVHSASDTTSTLAVRLPADPASYGMGWASAHWIPTHNKALFWGGDSHNPNGDNSLRLYDPVAKRWERLTPNDGPHWDRSRQVFSNGSVALTNRDNHLDFYVPARDEFWAFFGNPSGIGAPGSLSGHFGGVFSLKQKKWTRVANTAPQFAAGLIKDFEKFNQVYNPAHCWSEALNTGVWFGGATIGSLSGTLGLIEPNPKGPEPYQLVLLDFSAPKPLGYFRNSAVCVGEYFYMYGGMYQDTKWVESAGSYATANSKELWRLHIPSRKWVRLVDGPAGVYYPSLTHDTRRNQLVLMGGSKGNHLHIYDIARDRWHDKTAEARLPYMHLQVAVFSPVSDEHLFRGGLFFDRQGNALPYHTQPALYGVRLEGSLATERSNASVGPPPTALNTIPEAKPVDAAMQSSEPSTTGSWRAIKLPASGHGPSGDIKHLRLAVRPSTGLIYILGGDYSGPRFMDSGRQELYSYDIIKDVWALQFPYCAKAGEVSPRHPDQVGWAYDSKRDLFWMMPGYQGPENDCGGVIGKTMTFDPTTRKWAIADISDPPKNEYLHSKFSQYDSVQDQIVMLGNSEARHWHLTTGKGERVGFGGNRDGLSSGYTALVDREIFGIDTRSKKLSRYHLDHKRISDEPLPFDPGPGEVTNLVFDSGRRAVVFAKFPSYDIPSDPKFRWWEPELWLYFVDEKRWEKRKVAIPGVTRPRANSMVFHPSGKILFLGGGEPANPHLYLYTP